MRRGFDFSDIIAERAAFEHEFGHDADTTAEPDHSEDAFVTRDFGVDVGADVVLAQPLIEPATCQAATRNDEWSLSEIERGLRFARSDKNQIGFD